MVMDGQQAVRRSYYLPEIEIKMGWNTWYRVGEGPR